MTTNTTPQPTTEADPRFWLGVFLPTAGLLLGALALTLGWSSRLPSAAARKWDWSTQEVITVAFTAASLPVMPSNQVGLEDPLLAPDRAP